MTRAQGRLLNSVTEKNYYSERQNKKKEKKNHRPSKPKTKHWEKIIINEFELAMNFYSRSNVWAKVSTTTSLLSPVVALGWLTLRLINDANDPTMLRPDTRYCRIYPL
jgi:hypothetical protein